MRVVGRIVEYVKSKGIGAETIRYTIVGVLATIINYGIYELLRGVFGDRVTIRNLISIPVAIVFAYVANKLYVFRRHCDSMSALALEFGKFIGSRLFTMALEVGGVELLHGVLGLDDRLGKIISQVLVIISNYVLSKTIVFRSDQRSGS